MVSAAVTTPSQPSSRRHLAKQSAAKTEYVLAPTILQLLGAWNHEIADERAVVEYALAFANGETDRSALLHALELGSSYTAVTLEERAAILEWLTTSNDFGVEEPWKLKGAALEEFVVTSRNTSRIRAFLAQLMRGRKYAEALFTNRADELLVGIQAFPRVERTSRGLRMRWQTTIFDIAGFEAYLSLLLLDGDRGFGSALCRCRYEECGKYFLAASKTGRTRRMYCSQEHTALAHNASAAKRMAKLRARRTNSKPRKAK